MHTYKSSNETEEMPAEELKGHFDGLTGEDAKDIFKLCDFDIKTQSKI